MRTSDFQHVLTELAEQLDLQSGPVEQRPANVTFTKWVKLAGALIKRLERAICRCRQEGADRSLSFESRSDQADPM